MISATTPINPLTSIMIILSIIGFGAFILWHQNWQRTSRDREFGYHMTKGQIQAIKRYGR